MSPSHPTAALPPPMPPARDRLALTLTLAAALHAIVILGVGFSPFETEREPPLPTLDVTLVQRPSERAPEDADYLAAASQEGAGNVRERVRPEAPPRQVPLETPGPRAPRAELAHERAAPAPERLARPARGPAAQARPRPAPPASRQRPLSAAQLYTRSLELASLEAERAAEARAHARNPRERTVHARTRQHRYAAYMHAWVEKVERIGNLNYPEEARRRGLSGRLTLDVALNPDGTVRAIRVLRSSGHRVLDEAAVRIVRLAAPFAPFPPEIRRETDVLHIVRTWEFLSSNRLSGR